MNEWKTEIDNFTHFILNLQNQQWNANLSLKIENKYTHAHTHHHKFTHNIHKQTERHTQTLLAVSMSILQNFFFSLTENRRCCFIVASLLWILCPRFSYIYAKLPMYGKLCFTDASLLWIVCPC